MNILICNDDGVYAPGIKILAEHLRDVANVTVVAPLEERSTTSHTLTLDHPIRIVEIEHQVWGCSGYPADCALMGLAEIMKDRRPDLVVSGINRGANLGQDIYYSGTAAAAREAIFHGIKGIAVSSVLDFLPMSVTHHYYETAAQFIVELIKSGVTDLIAPMQLINVNVPNRPQNEIRGVELTHLGFRHYSEEIEKRTDFRQRPYYWIGGVYKGSSRQEGTDCWAIEQNKISLSVLNLLGQSTDRKEEWEALIQKLN
ncbi:MAG: 5'/3'-nucleotidase SurE [Bdellovibrio sp.]